MRGIGPLHLTGAEFDELVRSPVVHDALLADGVPVVVVDGAIDLEPPGSLPMVVCALGDATGAPGPAAADVVVAEADIDAIVAAVAHAPLAAATLVLHLRAVVDVPVEHALTLESEAYSTLQSGPEFTGWRSRATDAPDVSVGDSPEPVVRVERSGDALIVTLCRPHRHNAIDARLRDELCDALTIALADASITSVELCGDGPSFCSGGDLAEFGQRSDPASAHRLRLVRSPARLMHRLRQRTTVRVHGATLGGGLELAAFAATVEAHPDTRFALPELALGLMPGAGGTVSLPRRIGRQRTALLALTGRRIDAHTAVAWGLVDRIAPG